MKFEFATVEVKKFDLEDILTASGDPKETTAATESTRCPLDNSLPCFGDD